jgi:hypothetical protein
MKWSARQSRWHAQDALTRRRRPFEKGGGGIPKTRDFRSSSQGLRTGRKSWDARASCCIPLCGCDRRIRTGNEFLGSLYLLEGNLPAALKYWNRVGKPVVGDVRFVPAPRVDPVLLARLPAVSAGQVLTLRRLVRTEAAMRDSGIFADVRFRLSAAVRPTL